jgi:hypothetical protein
MKRHGQLEPLETTRNRQDGVEKENHNTGVGHGKPRYTGDLETERWSRVEEMKRKTQLRAGRESDEWKDLWKMPKFTKDAKPRLSTFRDPGNLFHQFYFYFHDKLIISKWASYHSLDGK